MQHYVLCTGLCTEHVLADHSQACSCSMSGTGSCLCSDDREEVEAEIAIISLLIIISSQALLTGKGVPGRDTHQRWLHLKLHLLWHLPAHMTLVKLPAHLTLVKPPVCFQTIVLPDWP